MNRFLLLFALLALPAEAAAQRTDTRTVTGIVLDAATGEGLPGATVLVEPSPAGLAGPEPGTGAVRAGWGDVTDDLGAYRLRGLAPGDYVLRVSRPGYRSATIGLRVARPEPARVSVGLALEPVPMEPLEVRVAGEPGPRRAEEAELGASRLDMERLVRELYLSGDVRGIVREDVIEAVTLAESDLFRALQRLPGVTSRDDYTAELWTRGAPWSHTRVLFDGLPLFNPLHGAGVFSAVDAEAVETAFFHPGARPARIAGGVAGVLELASRPGGPQRQLAGRGELSLVSARVALDRGFERGGWMVTGRRTHLDLVTWAVESVTGADDVHVPYAFHDVAGRLDLDLGSRVALEASFLWEADRVSGDVEDVLVDSPSRWGNTAGRVTVDAVAAGLRVRTTVGTSRYSARGLRDDLPGLDREGSAPALRESGFETDQSLVHWSVGATVEPASPGGRWAAGAEVVSRNQEYAGPAPNPHPGFTSLQPLDLRDRLGWVSAWIDRRFAPHPALQIDLGVRLDAGGDVVDAAGVRPAPRLAARWSPGAERVSVSAGWSRIHQYDQVLAPSGFSVGPRLHPVDVWLLAGDSLPVLRSDVATLGLETWLDERWIGAVNAYARATDGMAVPDPTPGPVVHPATFVPGEARARGLELSLRRPIGRWTASFGYAWGRATLEADGHRYPAPTERRHAVDALLATRLGGGWRLSAAYGWASGAPYTPFVQGFFDCADWPEEPCRTIRPAETGEPGERRAPSWSSLDLGVDWTTERERWTMAVFAQVRNVLNADNAVTYGGASVDCDTCPPVDEFEGGLPILPAVGVRVAF